ncbi:MAG: type VI secretion system lipoprotein TssJ [Reinekea sp.]
MKASQLKSPLVFLFFSLLAFGCAAPSLDVDLSSDGNLNQDSTGTSYSVLVRLYQLSDPSLFEKASVSSLFRQDDEILSATLVSKKELSVAPNTQAVLEIPKDEASRYLGVVAFYRDTKSERQIAVKKVNYGKLKFSTKLQLQLVDNNIFLSYR